MSDQIKQNGDIKEVRHRAIVSSIPFLFIVGTAIFFVSFLLSSFPISRQPLEIQQIQQVYFADNISDGHRALIKAFNEAHQGEVEVIAVDLPFSKFNTNQRKDLIARNLRSSSSRIDIFAVDLIWVPRFTKWAEPVAPYFSPNFLGHLLSESLETCYVDGLLYAVPLYIDIGALLYREDMILALPDGEAINERIKASISWEELLQIADKYFPDQAVYMPQAQAYEGLICNFNEILGQSLLDPQTGEIVDLTDSLIVARIQFMRDLITSGKSPEEVLFMTEDDCIHYALANDVPFIRGWPTANIHGGERFDPTKFEKIRIAPLPHFKGSAPSPVFGGWNMMLSKHSPVKEAAIKFMRFAASFEGQQMLFQSEGTLPVHSNFYLADFTPDEEREQLQSIYKMMKQGIHRPAVEKYTLISDILSQRLHQILAGELAADQGMQLAWEEVKAIQSEGTER